jgi:putative transposase
LSRTADGPRSSPNRTTEDIKKQAIGVRAALEQSGLDHGPISVHEKMRDLGMTPVPSTAALARIFRDANVAQAEPLRQDPNTRSSLFSGPGRAVVPRLNLWRSPS